MPNWVQNRITIIGPESRIREIHDLVKDNDECKEDSTSILKHYFPLPEDATEVRASTNSEGVEISYSVFTDKGYEDAIKLWGTKWADCDTYAPDDPVPVADGIASLTLSCQTAWSPPLAGFQALSEQFGLLIGLSFEEEQPDFIGCCVLANGSEWYFHEESGDRIDAAFPPYPNEGTGDEQDEWWGQRNDVIAEFRTLIDGHLNLALRRLTDRYLKSLEVA